MMFDIKVQTDRVHILTDVAKFPSVLSGEMNAVWLEGWPSFYL